MGTERTASPQASADFRVMSLADPVPGRVASGYSKWEVPEGRQGTLFTEMHQFAEDGSATLALFGNQTPVNPLYYSFNLKKK